MLIVSKPDHFMYSLHLPHLLGGFFFKLCSCQFFSSFCFSQMAWNWAISHSANGLRHGKRRKKISTRRNLIEFGYQFSIWIQEPMFTCAFSLRCLFFLSLSLFLPVRIQMDFDIFFRPNNFFSTGFRLSQILSLPSTSLLNQIEFLVLIKINFFCSFEQSIAVQTMFTL